MSLLGVLNFVVHQWFWIRLARRIHDDGHKDWTVIRVLPLSGWWSDFAWWGRPA